MRIIDCHCHIYPQKIAHKAVAAIGDFYHIPMKNDGTVETLLANGEKAGVTNFIVHSAATTAHQVKSVNEFVAKEVSLHPHKLIGFGTLHPYSEDMEGDVQHLLELGLKGVKIHHDFLKMPVDDPSCFKIYELCSHYGIPICLHTGDKRYDNTNPNRLAPLAKRYPKLKIIAAHFGGYTIWEDAAKVLPDIENIYVDCSSSFEFLSQDKAREILRAYGAERVLFGTDYPMWNHVDEIRLIEGLGLTEDELGLIYHKNAEKLLGLTFED